MGKFMNCFNAAIKDINEQKAYLKENPINKRPKKSESYLEYKERLETLTVQERLLAKQKKYYWANREERIEKERQRYHKKKKAKDIVKEL